MKNKVTLLAIGLALVLAGAMVSFGWKEYAATTRTHAASTPGPVVSAPSPAPPGSQEAPPAWITQYDQMMDMYNDLQARKISAVERYIAGIEAEKDTTQRGLDEFQLENDIIMGINTRLGNQVPQGMVWDNGVRKFVPKPAVLQKK